jgi:poly(3-hydroxybutyrate) depolymerase
MAWPGRFVLDLIDSLRAEFAAIDTNRIYISGGSMGGVGTWYLCQYKPGLFAAAFPICGSGDTTLPNAYVNLPLWTFAGTADNEVPYSATRAMIAAIKRAGGNPRYTEVAGEGHTNTLIGGAAQNRDVHVWLFNQTKATTSVHLSSARSCPKEATSTGHTGIFRMVTLNSPPGMPFQIDLMGRSVTIHNSTAHASGEKAPALYIADFQKLR